MRIALPHIARAAIAAFFVLIAVVSAVRSTPDVWRPMRSERRAYRKHLRPANRYYLHVLERGFGIQDLSATVRTLGQLYLLPAVIVSDPQDATVVLSW